MAEPVIEQNISQTDEAQSCSAITQEITLAVESHEGVEADEPPTKKTKTSTTSGNTESPYPYARLRGIRIFSEREIKAQDAEMTRAYWNFWNQTAEELCSDRAYNDWGKRDLKLYIDAAWVADKTRLQEDQEKQLQEGIKELQERYGHTELPAKLKTEDDNVTELLTQLQDSTANLMELNSELTKLRGKFLNVKQRPVSETYLQETKDEDVEEMSTAIGKKEKDLYDGMADVKKNQDSLKKALSRLSNQIQKAKPSCPQLSIIMNPPLATIETTIIHQM